MAIVGHSYFYHTQKVHLPSGGQNICWYKNASGSRREYRARCCAGKLLPLLFWSQCLYGLQHMAENTMALLRHFTGPESPLPTLLHITPNKPQIVYFSILGTWFCSYSFEVASAMYTALLGTLCYFAIFEWLTNVRHLRCFDRDCFAVCA